MKKTINGKEFYLLSSDLIETAYFVRHLDDDPLGLKWELKRVVDGEVKGMENEFFLATSDVLNFIAKRNNEDVDDITIYAEMNEDGTITGKPIKTEYKCYAETWNNNSGFDGCICDIADSSASVAYGNETVESAVGDISWAYESADMDEIYASNAASGKDVKMTEAICIAHTDVILQKQVTWENEYLRDVLGCE